MSVSHKTVDSPQFDNTPCVTRNTFSMLYFTAKCRDYPTVTSSLLSLGVVQLSYQQSLHQNKRLIIEKVKSHSLSLAKTITQTRIQQFLRHFSNNHS